MKHTKREEFFNGNREARRLQMPMRDSRSESYPPFNPNGQLCTMDPELNVRIYRR